MTPVIGKLAGTADADDIATSDAMVAAIMTFSIWYSISFNQWYPSPRHAGRASESGTYFWTFGRVLACSAVTFSTARSPTNLN